jgi:hypothetical protein
VKRHRKIAILRFVILAILAPIGLPIHLGRGLIAGSIDWWYDVSAAFITTVHQWKGAQ